MRRLLFLIQAMALTIFTLPLSSKSRAQVYRILRGYDIAVGAEIGICFISSASVTLNRGSRIGHMTCVRNLKSLSIGENSRIGSFNWIFGNMKSGSVTESRSSLTMGPESSITSRHIIDCSASVHLGAYSTLAGYRTQILTHGIDIAKGRQNSMPVLIGDYCMIGSGCLILKGSVIPDGSVLAAGSTFHGRSARGYGLFSGVPAKRVKDLDPASEYFRRVSGPVL